jgi:hypothetical protein
MVDGWNLAQVRHEKSQNRAKCFEISLGYR